ncbi:MAG: hypothetical protein QW331_01255 [Candidatus Woesearchaeota archaeon]
MRKVLVAVVFCISLLVISGFHLYTPRKGLGKEITTDVKTCTDTDSDSFYQQGTLEVEYVSGEKEHFKDYCIGENLFEYSCFEAKPRAPKAVYCKATCRLGRCYDVYNTTFASGQNFSITREQSKEAYLKRKQLEEERILRLRQIKDIAGNIISFKNKVSTAIDSCEETDDGLDRYRRGDIEIGYANGEKEHFRDICRGDTLFEYHCDKDSPRKPEIIRCKLGCRNGICVDTYQSPAGHEKAKSFSPRRLRERREYEKLPEHLKAIYDKPINESYLYFNSKQEKENLRKSYVTNCTETDNGKDIFSAGTLTLRYQEGTETFYEKCLDRFHVFEYSCNGRFPRTATAIQCPYGCQLGACVKRI